MSSNSVVKGIHRSPHCPENKCVLQLSWWRHQMETFSASLAFCAGNSQAQRPVTRSFDVFFNLRLNQQLSKHVRRRWFETPSRSLWRHCNVAFLKIKNKLLNSRVAGNDIQWMPLIPFEVHCWQMEVLCNLMWAQIINWITLYRLCKISIHIKKPARVINFLYICSPPHKINQVIAFHCVAHRSSMQEPRQWNCAWCTPYLTNFEYTWWRHQMETFSALLALHRSRWIPRTKGQ